MFKFSSKMRSVLDTYSKEMMRSCCLWFTQWSFLRRRDSCERNSCKFKNPISSNWHDRSRWKKLASFSRHFCARTELLLTRSNEAFEETGFSNYGPTDRSVTWPQNDVSLYIEQWFCCQQRNRCEIRDPIFRFYTIRSFWTASSKIV